MDENVKERYFSLLLGQTCGVWKCIDMSGDGLECCGV